MSKGVENTHARRLHETTYEQAERRSRYVAVVDARQAKYVSARRGREVRGGEMLEIHVFLHGGGWACPSDKSKMKRGLRRAP